MMSWIPHTYTPVSASYIAPRLKLGKGMVWGLGMRLVMHCIYCSGRTNLKREITEETHSWIRSVTLSPLPKLFLLFNVGNELSYFSLQSSSPVG